MYFVGVDIGGTKIEIGLVDQYGKVVSSKRFPTDAASGPDIIINRLTKHLSDLIDSVKSEVAIAGQVDSQRGVVISSPNLPGWQNIDLKTVLSKTFSLPVKVLNDVRAITLGEWKFGSGTGCADFLCIFIGTGIGGGVVSGNKLLEGASSTFAELGHMTIQSDGPVCTCGNRGCIEAFAGGWAIAKEAQRRVAAKQQATILSSYDIVSAKEVISAYRDGDVVARQVIELATQAFKVACISFVHLYNPSVISLGGGILTGLPEIVSMVDEFIKQNAMRACVVNTKVVPAALLNSAGVIGAATSILEE